MLEINRSYSNIIHSRIKPTSTCLFLLPLESCSWCLFPHWYAITTLSYIVDICNNSQLIVSFAYKKFLTVIRDRLTNLFASCILSSTIVHIVLHMLSCWVVLLANPVNRFIRLAVERLHVAPVSRHRDTFSTIEHLIAPSMVRVLFFFLQLLF